MDNKFLGKFKTKKINIIEMGAGNGEMIYQIIRSSKMFLIL